MDTCKIELLFFFNIGKKQESLVHTKVNDQSKIKMLRSEGILNCNLDDAILLTLFDEKSALTLSKSLEVSSLKDIIYDEYYIFYNVLSKIGPL